MYLPKYKAALNTPSFMCLREECFCRLKQSCDICLFLLSLPHSSVHFPPQYPNFTLPPQPCSCSIPLSEYLYLFLPFQPSLLDPVSVISHLVQVLTPAKFWQAQYSKLPPTGANYYYLMGSSSPLCCGSQVPTL